MGTGVSDGDAGAGLSDGLLDGLALAGSDGDGEDGDGEGGDGEGVGADEGGTAVSTTASTTAAASNSTAAAAASHRRRSPVKIAHMLHCRATGHSRSRAEVPGTQQNPKQRGVTWRPC